MGLVIYLNVYEKNFNRISYLNKTLHLFHKIWEWGMGNGEWGMGNGEWGMGNGEWVRNNII
jgi:hypothetical protein